jgi:hypothetical protein
MTSQIDICNMAIGKVGGNRIDNIDEPSQVEAILCKDHYNTIVDSILESAEWSFAIKREVMSLDPSPPIFGYSYRYKLPTSCIRLLQCSEDSAFAVDTPWAREGEYVLSESSTLYVRYIQHISDPMLYSGMFIEAVVLKLASALAIPLTGDKKLHEALMQAFENTRNDAANKDSLQGRTGEFQNYALINAR